jgi:TonB-dependent SusC/RagA subfamily outer membrane receptor
MKNSILLLIAALMLMPFSLPAQKKSSKKVKIKGYVMTAEGKPVAGAVFLADDIQLNARSNQDGFFSFRTGGNTEKITALSLNYGAMEIPFLGQDSMIFIFEQDPEIAPDQLTETYPALDFEYGKIRQNPGNSQTELDGSKYTSIYELIQGELPGVQVRGTSITVMQGQASFDPNATFEPLIILSGVPTSSIGNVHPSEVKSVELLKGADASLYGSRGANGVIIINLR